MLVYLELEALSTRKIYVDESKYAFKPIMKQLALLTYLFYLTFIPWSIEFYNVPF